MRSSSSLQDMGSLNASTVSNSANYATSKSQQHQAQDQSQQASYYSTTLTSTSQISSDAVGSSLALHPKQEDLPGVATSGRVKRLLVAGLFVTGLIVCVITLVCILLLPTFVSNQISKRLVLKNNSMLLERWSKPNVPMYFKVWLFDVKNAQEVIEKRGTKPQVREVGPFVFHLKRQKDIVSFAGDNLYYTERKLYHFSPELSCCAINTTVTVPNIPLVAVVDRALSYNLPLVGRFIPRLINRAIQSLREQLFVRRQVRELLFDGYDVELLRMVSRVGSLVGIQQTTSQRFAILKGRNDSWRPEQDGVWAINTGARDRSQFGRVSSWNSYRQLPFWASPGCNKINGSDGTLFPPPIKSSEPLYIFNQELCRTVNLVYDRPSDIRSIAAYRFVLNPLNFAHTMVSPQPLSSGSASKPPPSSNRNPRRMKEEPKLDAQAEQAERMVRAVQAAQELGDKGEKSRMNPFTCFCDRKTTNLNGINVCEFDGLIDLSKCTKQAQVIFGSMPHFHQGDRRLLNQVVGLEPNASKHTTYLDIEPNTGLVLGGKRRVQLNLLIKHNNEVEGFENVNDMLVPVMWFEESAMIPEESARKFRSLYTDRIRIINIVLSSLFVAALGLLAIDARLLASQYQRFKVTPSSPGDQPQTHASKKVNADLGSISTLRGNRQQIGAIERRQSTCAPLLAPIELAIPYRDSLVGGTHPVAPYSDESGKSVIALVANQDMVERAQTNQP